MQDILITGTGSELQGVGRAVDGRAIFVPGALPGERVRVEIVKESERYAHARLVEVLIASDDRVEPLCPYYGACGGCQTQHMTYALSLLLKRQRVIDAFSRIGELEGIEVREVIGALEVERGRNKAEYAVKAGGVGCNRAASHDVIAVEDCLLQHPKSVRAMRVFDDWLKKHPHSGMRYLVTRVTAHGEMAVTVSSEGEARGLKELADVFFRLVEGVVSVHHCRLNRRYAHALDGVVRLVRGADTVSDELFDLSFELSPQSFFQVNRVQAERLYDCAMDAACLSGDEVVVDAYCGAGTISLCMARNAAKVIGIEIVPEAVNNARRNAVLNGLSDKTEFFTGRVEDVLPRVLTRNEHLDVLTLDPPRKGIDRLLVGAIQAAGPERIVYVSCNPATLARDVALLCSGRTYRCEWVQPVDMFPWTGHVESVVLMSRADG